MSAFPSNASNIAMRWQVTFPYRVVAGSGVEAPISNGTITFGLDYAPLASAAPISTPSNFTVALLDETTGEYKTATLDQLPTTTTGDVRTARGDANYAILAADRYVALTASLTTARTWSLPAASTVTGGIRIAVYDEAGGITSTNTLTVGVTGSDTIDGSSTFVLNNAYAGAEFRSDGISKWTVAQIGTTQIAAGALAATTAGRAKMADGFLSADTTGRAKMADKFVTNAKLNDMAQATVKGRASGAGTGVPTDLTGAQIRTIAAALAHATPTVITTNSGTSHDFTGIPAGCKRIVVSFDGVSINATGDIIVQIGDSGGIETSGYTGSWGYLNNAAASAEGDLSSGFSVSGGSGGAAGAIYGHIELVCHNPLTNTWTASGALGFGSTSSIMAFVGGSKTLSGELDRVRLTTVAGTAAFDNGTFAVNYFYL